MFSRTLYKADTVPLRAMDYTSVYYLSKQLSSDTTTRMALMAVGVFASEYYGATAGTKNKENSAPTHTNMEHMGAGGYHW